MAISAQHSSHVLGCSGCRARGRSPRPRLEGRPCRGTQPREHSDLMLCPSYCEVGGFDLRVPPANPRTIIWAFSTLPAAFRQYFEAPHEFVHLLGRVAVDDLANCTLPQPLLVALEVHLRESYPTRARGSRARSALSRPHRRGALPYCGNAKYKINS